MAIDAGADLRDARGIGKGKGRGKLCGGRGGRITGTAGMRRRVFARARKAQSSKKQTGGGGRLYGSSYTERGLERRERWRRRERREACQIVRGKQHHDPKEPAKWSTRRAAIHHGFLRCMCKEVWIIV